MAFLKKEIKEYLRSGRFLILGILAVIFGIMNPVIAKLTPKFIEMLGEQMQESGMQVSIVKVDAFASWQQYYKNLPMLLLIFLLLCAGSFTKEYAKGSLVLVVTKGYPRRNIYIAKVLTMTAAYTAVSLICFGITFFYTGYYWDNTIVAHPFAAALMYWLFGLFMLAVMIFFSTFLTDTGAVCGAAAGTLIFIYILGIIPKAGKYLPTKLCEGEKIIKKAEKLSGFGPAAAITAALVIALLSAGCILFKKASVLNGDV